MQMEGENGGGLGTRLGIIMENSRNMGNGGFLQPDQHDNGMAATIKTVKKYCKEILQACNAQKCIKAV